MNLKEFLKFDTIKIVIFVVIVILANLPKVGYITVQTLCECVFGEKCGECPQAMELSVFFYPFLQQFSHYLFVDNFTYGIPIIGVVRSIAWWPSIGEAYATGVLFLLFAGNVVYWYLISCTVVWIYDKLKKR